MRVAITADSPSESAPVSPVFGRCAYYAIYDTATGKLDFMQNPGGMMARGAGVQSAQFIASQGIQVLITAGVVGPNASMVLAQAGIEVVNGFQGTVADAVRAAKDGRLQGTAPSYPSMPTYYPANPYVPVEMSPEDELRMLEEEKAYIEERLEEIKKRLKELKK
jgi:predicted Fe-Mo cluster-binding NifX family protein